MVKVRISCSTVSFSASYHWLRSHFPFASPSFPDFSAWHYKDHHWYHQLCSTSGPRWCSCQYLFLGVFLPSGKIHIFKPARCLEICQTTSTDQSLSHILVDLSHTLTILRQGLGRPYDPSSALQKKKKKKLLSYEWQHINLSQARYIKKAEMRTEVKLLSR